MPCLNRGRIISGRNGAQGIAIVAGQRSQRTVQRQARRLAATIGNMLEFYDFITYQLLCRRDRPHFFPANSEYGSLMLSLATFGAGFLTRPIGGIVLGIFSDRVGRRPAMLLSLP